MPQECAPEKRIKVNAEPRVVASQGTWEECLGHRSGLGSAGGTAEAGIRLKLGTGRWKQTVTRQQMYMVSKASADVVRLGIPWDKQS